MPGGGGRTDETLHCHHQGDFCIKMGSYEKHFNISFFILFFHREGHSHKTMPVSYF